MMTWLEALVLGLIQGLTEFLPVSSSGHLQIFSTLFGIQGEENLTFAVAVHAATVCSTIVVLRNEIWDLLKGLFRFSWNPETIYIAKASSPFKDGYIFSGCFYHRSGSGLCRIAWFVPFRFHHRYGDSAGE